MGEVLVASSNPILVDDEYMLPFESGGAVPYTWVRRASRDDLGFSDNLEVVYVDQPRNTRRKEFFSLATNFLTWWMVCCPNETEGYLHVEEDGCANGVASSIEVDGWWNG